MSQHPEAFLRQQKIVNESSWEALGLFAVLDCLVDKPIQCIEYLKHNAMKISPVSQADASHMVRVSESGYHLEWLARPSGLLTIVGEVITCRSIMVGNHNVPADLLKPKYIGRLMEVAHERGKLQIRALS